MLKYLYQRAIRYSHSVHVKLGAAVATNLRILVSGASIAGPAAAYWLTRAGNDVTVIERADAVRTAGQNIDVRGTGREVLRQMNLEAAVLARNTGEIGTSFVDDSGTPICRFPAATEDDDGLTAEVEILRGELAELVIKTVSDDVDFRFGQQIVGINDEGDGAQVTFSDQSTETFDLVVIAEGTSSRTRQMVFGDVPKRQLGLYTAYGTIPRQDDDNRWWNWYNAPGGRSITVRPDNKGTTRVALSFLSSPRGYEREPMDRQKKIIRDVFHGVGWRAPQILDLLDATDELYVDYLTQIFAPEYSRGSTVLLGDAAWCATPLSGVGTTLALTGAYVLAGELAWAPTVAGGLRGYQEQMRGFVEAAQSIPPGGPRLAHPKTVAGVKVLRTALRVLGSRPVRKLGGALPTPSTKAKDLPRYPELEAMP